MKYDLPPSYSLATTKGHRFRFTRPGFMSEPFASAKAAVAAAWEEAGTATDDKSAAKPPLFTTR